MTNGELEAALTTRIAVGAVSLELMEVDEATELVAAIEAGAA